MSSLGAGTLSSLQFASVVDALGRLDVDTAPILAACGLDRVVLDDPSARVDAELEHTFWACVEERTRNPAIGLKLGTLAMKSGRKGVDVYIGENSASWRNLIENAELFVRLSDDRGHIQLFEEDDLATIRTYRDGGFRRASGYIDSLFSIAVTASFERVTGFRLTRVRFRRAAPASAEVYRDVFGVMPEFGAENNELTFPRELLDVPLRGSDPILADILKAHATQLLREIPETHPLRFRIQRALIDGLARGNIGMPTIAQSVGMSPRTLRRRLSAFGTTFQSMVDELRRDVACHRLRDGDESVGNLAEHLGFASTSAFQRAFERWTGMSPSAFRDQERAMRRSAVESAAAKRES